MVDSPSFSDWVGDEQMSGSGLSYSDESCVCGDFSCDHYEADGSKDEAEIDECSDVESREGTNNDSDDIQSETGGECIAVDSLVDILKLDLVSLSVDEVDRLEFLDQDIAYLFYQWYAKFNGFAIRKGHVIRSKSGELLQQTFLCCRQGFRAKRMGEAETSKRRPRNESRCGCEAKFRVHINSYTLRWYVSVFIFDHNHELVLPTEAILLTGNRKLSNAELMQIENFRLSGIRCYQMYDVMATAAGGYDCLGFIKKDLYNQIGNQGRRRASDASGAVSYLMSLKEKDPLMYVKHTVDNESRLQHIFWCDGEGRLSYEVFGEVLAFDATYKKNKYECPFVVFSGVNHHNQTVVFGNALVSNEKEETYVWLLKEFMKAMKQKAPKSVITDGYLPMKNAIKRVFPNAHHRLCAWHLLRCAVRNIHIPEFLTCFKTLMLGDLEISRFEELWSEVLTRFELGDNNWIRGLYEKKKQWATSYIRGNFFAGLRTTSRCEGFHSHMKLFVHPRINLTDFFIQFQRCLAYFRFREVEADVKSNYGDAVLQTDLPSLERSAANVYTNEIFFKVRSYLRKSLLFQVVDSQEMSMCKIYSVLGYGDERTVWKVSCSVAGDEFRCCCLRMESLGLPCSHILAVVVRLQYLQLPKCLIYSRWTKGATDVLRGRHGDGTNIWDSDLVGRFATSAHLSKIVSEKCYRNVDSYNEYMDLLTAFDERIQGQLMPSLQNGSIPTGPSGLPPSFGNIPTQSSVADLGNPCRINDDVNHRAEKNNLTVKRKAHSCGICGGVGHNRRRCEVVRQSQGPNVEEVAEDGNNANCYVDEDVEHETGPYVYCS